MPEGFVLLVCMYCTCTSVRLSVMNKKSILEVRNEVLNDTKAIKALGHAIRADCLLNLKPDAIMPHTPTQ